MILGLRTVIYAATDLALGREWYSRVFETSPYFDEPFYVGFTIGGFELGLIPDGVPGQAGGLAYWGVADIDQEMVRIEQMGVVVEQPIADVGGGVRHAVVLDPFGNRIGLIQNPNFIREEVQ